MATHNCILIVLIYILLLCTSHNSVLKLLQRHTFNCNVLNLLFVRGLPCKKNWKIPIGQENSGSVEFPLELMPVGLIRLIFSLVP